MKKGFLVLLTLITSSAHADFLTSHERLLVDHTEFKGILFLDAEQFGRSKDPRTETAYEPGEGVVEKVAKRGSALAYLVSADVLFLIQLPWLKDTPNEKAERYSRFHI